jgi:hypothetical protein
MESSRVSKSRCMIDVFIHSHEEKGIFSVPAIYESLVMNITQSEWRVVMYVKLQLN